MNPSKTKAFVCALTALSMGFSGLALAQDRDHHDNRGRPGPDRHDMRRDNDNRGGAGPEHNWRRGSRLPTEYRSHQYVVDDWRGHRLSAPPRGYHWVQAGPDYVLAAIATGIIAQVLLNH